MNEEIKNIPDLRELGDVIGDGFLWGSNAFCYKSFPSKNSQVTNWRKNYSDNIADNFGKNNLDNKVYSSIKDALTNKDNYNIPPKELSLTNYQNYIALAKKLNLNSISINLDWARIEPNKGNFSASALKLYKKIIKDAEASGIVTLINLWDLSHPIWFEEIGGFFNKKNIKFFLNFIDKAISLIPPGTSVITFNDPTQIINVKSIIKDKQARNSIKLYSNIISAHHQAVRLIKASSESNRVGISIPITIFSSGNKQKKINSLVKNIFLREIKKSCDFFGLIINDNYSFKDNKNQKIITAFLDGEAKKQIYGDLKEGNSENLLVNAINYFDKKLQMPILIISGSVSDLEQKYYPKELEITINAIFKTAVHGASIIGLMYSSLISSQPLEEGIFTSRSLAMQNVKTGKISLHLRARAISRLILQVNKVRKPNYQPIVSAIIDSMNQHKQSKKNKVTRFLGESAKKLSSRVDSVKYKNRLIPANKMLSLPRKSVLRLSTGGEGVNPFNAAKNLSVDSINRVKLKSAQVKNTVVGKANFIQFKKPDSSKITKPMGDFIKFKFKKPGITPKINKPTKTKNNKKII